MRKILLLCAVLCGTLTTVFAQQRSCASHEHMLEQLQNNPAFQQRMDEIEEATKRFNFADDKALANGVATIPVIVHVVARTSAENISDAQIQSQIDVLNADFRRLNADRSNTPSDFLPVASDTEIEFCLTDVIRVSTTRTSFGTNDAVKQPNQGGSAAVNPNGAMNFWVCNIGGGILGYAQFPGGPASTDGIVVDYRYFGTTGTATAPFDLGRTATHEVGHYLNLRHIWGDGNCRADDFVNDTPLAGGPNYTGGACTYPGPNSCSPRRGADLPDMFQNYMDYSDDGCMNLFTVGQRDRMWAALQASRPGLLAAACDGTPPPPPPAEEICNNGIDDDGDGQIDCADGDCATDASCDNGGGGDDCAAPTGLTHTRRKGGREAILSWNAVSGASSYDVEVYQNGSLTASGTVSGTSANISGLRKNSPYTWRVRANCATGTSDWADAAFNARLFGSTDVAGLRAAPNPTAGGTVRLDWDLSTTTNATPSVSELKATTGTVSLELFDVTGRRLLQQTLGNVETAELNVTSLTAGVYLVRITDQAGQTAITRLVRR